MRKRCQILAVTLIPKNYAAYIPINMKATELDLILIDDNRSLIKSWELAAKIAGKKIKTYNNPDNFLSCLSDFSEDTPIYVDYDLKIKLTGIELTKRLYEQGFKKLYLATGYEKSHFAEPIPWLVDIVNKKPPFRII